MTERELFWTMTWVLMGFSLIALVLLLLMPAPYGRFVRRGFGPEIPSRLGWVLMEAPAVLVFAGAYFSGQHWREPAPLALFSLWQLHYVYRTFVYPFRMRGAKTMTLAIAAYVFLFVTAPYGYLNGRWLSHFGDYSSDWLVDPRFLLGAPLFLVGFGLNLHSDQILMKLRKPGETGYKVPQGGLFRWLSCPNYFGEILEWTGFAIASWSLPGLAFALWGAANLVPRARASHRWYQENFPDYPRKRRAVIPGLL